MQRQDDRTIVYPEAESFPGSALSRQGVCRPGARTVLKHCEHPGMALDQVIEKKASGKCESRK
jgi:hypothetical protein